MPMVHPERGVVRRSGHPMRVVGGRARGFADARGAGRGAGSGRDGGRPMPEISSIPRRAARWSRQARVRAEEVGCRVCILKTA